MAPIGKLFTFPNNPRAFKALIAAKYNGVELEQPSFTLGVTNKEPAFLEKFPFGKVPAFESADGLAISESNAISYYVAASKKDTTLLGSSIADAARVQMFVNLAENEISPAAATWIYPILGFVPFNKEATEKAKADLKKSLTVLNKVLATRTYLVGEAPTLADIHVVIALLLPFRLVLDKDFRASIVNVTRYFVTLANQPEFKAVIGDIVLADKAAVYDPNNIGKKAEAPKAAAPAPAAAAPAKKEEKEEDDDIDLFGSDEEADAEAEELKKKRVAEYEAKKANKPVIIAKSSILLDIKPWDDTTDMKTLEEGVRAIEADGLHWGASKLVPVAFGIKKLQILCTVEDDKVGVDFLEEHITALEDYVQSMDVAAFNKI